MSAVHIKHTGKKLTGTVLLPASKSLANRLLLMRAVAGFKDLEIQNLSDARDTRTLESILKNLDQNNVADVLDAGTVMRFLTAYLSCLPGEWVLTGTPRMQQRPIGALVDVLRKLGADVNYEKNEGFPPLRINGKQLAGGPVEIDGTVSSQFISALLMVAPLFSKPLQLKIKGELVSVPYIEMTLALMQQWGAVYSWNENTITVQNTPYKRPTGKVFVESDWSAASYFYSLLALANEGELFLPDLLEKSLQGDSVCKEIFRNLGIETEFTGEGAVLKKTKLAPGRVAHDFIECPDIAQTLAVCCAALGVEAELKGLQTLKVKETDRILALVNELAKFGVRVAATDDSMMIAGGGISGGGVPLETYHDHRMAMSFAPLAMLQPLLINDPSVVEKSFPRFWDELKKLGFQVNEM